MCMEVGDACFQFLIHSDTFSCTCLVYNLTGNSVQVATHNLGSVAAYLTRRLNS